MILALLALVAFQPDPAIAKIYKYKDEHGKTHFTDDASSIPMRYRKKGSMRKFRGVAEPAPEVSTSSKPSKKKSTNKDIGLGSQDVALIKQTIQVFGIGVELGKRYKNYMPNFENGQAAINAIQGSLPLKEGLVSALEGTKVPELQGALGFLKQSISVDKQTTSIGSGLTRRIATIFSRLVSEGEQQATMIKGLEKALKDSEKKKAEAKKKKEEEAKKEKEEAAKKEKEEAAKKKKEEEVKKAEETIFK